MPESSLDCHLESTPDVCGGRPRIAGRRITVQDIAVWHERLGRSPDEIATEYDLSLGDIYAALAYYHDHRAAIDSLMLEDNTLIESVRAATPSKLLRKLNDS